MSAAIGAEDIIRIEIGKGSPIRPSWGPQNASSSWRETEWRVFGNEQGDRFYGGAWEGEVGTLRLDEYPYDEVCVMLSGVVALVDERGGRREFRAGDAFFVPRGFRGTWHTLEPAHKIFVALGPFG